MLGADAEAKRNQAEEAEADHEENEALWGDAGAGPHWVFVSGASASAGSLVQEVGSRWGAG